LLVNANTVECNVGQEKKEAVMKLFTMAL